jgi:hypothetical protein
MRPRRKASSCTQLTGRPRWPSACRPADRAATIKTYFGSATPFCEPSHRAKNYPAVWTRQPARRAFRSSGYLVGRPDSAPTPESGRIRTQNPTAREDGRERPLAPLLLNAPGALSGRVAPVGRPESAPALKLGRIRTQNRYPLLLNAPGALSGRVAPVGHPESAPALKLGRIRTQNRYPLLLNAPECCGVRSPVVKAETRLASSTYCARRR